MKKLNVKNIAKNTVNGMIPFCKGMAIGGVIKTVVDKVSGKTLKQSLVETGKRAAIVGGVATATFAVANTFHELKIEDEFTDDEVINDDLDSEDE